MAELTSAKIMVAGTSGLVGRHLATALKKLGANVVAVGKPCANLASLRHLEDTIRHVKPTLIFYAPAESYGIGMHQHCPATVYYESTIVFAHLMDAAQRFGVDKVVNVLSNCVYPNNAPVPCREADLWTGLPEPWLIPHGMGRRMSLVHAAAARAQYGLKTISLILASVYGPHDNFDPHRCQVMPGTIGRFVTAADEGVPRVLCWGTGTPTREFLHVRDAVRGILEAAVVYDSDEPLNIGNQQEVPIRELARVVARAAGYRGTIGWDCSKPDGRSRVVLDSARMRALLPRWEMTSLEEGVDETVKWFRGYLGIVRQPISSSKPIAS